MVDIPLIYKGDRVKNSCHMYAVVFVALGIVYISFGVYDINTIEISCGLLSLVTAIIILICQHCRACEIENEVGDSILDNNV